MSHTYTGTILGGPRDGEIITAPYHVLEMPVLVGPFPPYVAGDLPEFVEYRTDIYDFERDYDMRGWWVRRPT